MNEASLKPKTSPGAVVEPLDTGGWRLQVPSGQRGTYRLAQLDDYANLKRKDFPCQPPVRLALQARASTQEIPGTWGFGLWNDPFGMAILRGAEMIRLPALPNAAWFFFASPPNHLTLRDDLPGRGGLAAAFRSPRIPPPVLMLGAPALPMLAIPPLARLARRVGRRIINQDAASLPLDATAWHAYQVEWLRRGVIFWVDERKIFESEVSPLGPLGVVIWIDNQFAAAPPNGRVRFGTLPNPEPAWIEVTDIRLSGEEAASGW
jgi:hypothetical protein